MMDTKQEPVADLVEELRTAFDGDSVPRKNVALRRASDALASLDAEIAVLRKERDDALAALAKDARVDAILTALLVKRDDPNDGTRDHLPRILRDFLNEENGRAGVTGFNDGYAEGFGKAKAELEASQSEAAALAHTGKPTVQASDATPTQADIEAEARKQCFAVCSTGGFLDFENGCCSVCSSPDQCRGWRAFSSEARAALQTGGEE